MRIIRPVTLTDAMLTGSNVPETEVDTPAYNAGTTYDIGEQVSVADGLNLTFYVSRHNGNTGNAPAALTDWWKQIGTGYLAWDSGTTYTVGQYCTYNHKNYECLIGNTNARPDLNSTGTTPKWLDTGNSTRWLAFDDKVGSRVSRPDSVTFSLVLGESFDSIALLDLVATDVSVTMTDAIDGVVYDTDIDLLTGEAVDDWYGYFFDPIITTDAAVLLGLPPYSSATIDITITNTGTDAKVGTIALGVQKNLGATQYGASYGITDYSKKTEDSFGNFYVLERAYSKEMECEVFISSVTSFDDLNRTLSDYRATPLVWVGADIGYSSFIIYGFVRSFNTVKTGPNSALCRLKVLGLS